MTWTTAQWQEAHRRMRRINGRRERVRRAMAFLGWMMVGAGLGAATLLIILSCWSLQEFGGWGVTVTIAAFAGIVMAWGFWRAD